MAYIPTLKTKYKEEILPALMKEYGYKTVMQAPRLKKITLNQGLGKAAIADKKVIDKGIEERGMPIGVRVTLRGERMYEFLERLITASIPRIRDFRGINDKGFDGKGNYTFGISEQIIFPEIDIDKIDRIQGMDITFVTSANTDKEAMSLLKLFGIPFKNQQK